MRDPAVTVDPGRAVLQPVERALAGQGRAPTVPRLEPPQHHARHRIMPQLVVIDQVFVAERDAQHPLAQQGRNVVHNSVAGTAIRQAQGEPFDQPDRPIRRPEQQRAGVRADRPAIDSGHDPPPIDGCKTHPPPRDTPAASGSPPASVQAFVAEALPTFTTPMHLPLVRHAG
jgi:hypothetical protein